MELEGSRHDAGMDAGRTRDLESKGLTVMGFWESEALAQPEAVIEATLRFAGRRTLTPSPLQ
ncbi:hypothetical protein GCM10027359_25610 [Marilutibacter aestuarii]